MPGRKRTALPATPAVRGAAFYLLNASMLVRALELPIAFGFLVGAWSWIAWSGPLGVIAMALFAVNIIMTVRQQPSPVLQHQIPAQALQPLTMSK